MWRFRFLGDLSAERVGRPEGTFVALPPRKYTALLALLVLSPARRWGRDELTALFWPDSDGDTGRGALRTALSALRKEFGADLFETGDSRETLRLRDGAAVTDAAEFEALLTQAKEVRSLPDREAAVLDAALALYNGPLLPGLYSDRIVAERERLETLAAQAHRRRDALRQVAALAAAADAAAREQSSVGGGSRKAEGPRLLRLPLYNGPFIGRDAEVETLCRLLGAEDRSRRPRLLTLTGVGGMGKTRLAVETARTASPQFAGAVCFVPLAALQNGAEVGGALADSLHIDAAAAGANGGGDDDNGLGQAVFLLRELGPSLLILDNAEQIVEHGAGQAVRSLLAAVPDLTLLVTSRRLLGVDGEREIALAPLPPESCQRLFREHARAAAAADDIDAALDDTLPLLCERLEGIPLAVELCAPWVRVLSGPQMLEQMERRFRLLTSRRQDMPARHRSLHAALEWGCPTDPDLREFFAALSVFRGGWTLQAAEAVGGGDALEHLASLREQSLVLAEVPDSSGGKGDRSVMRYRFLETVREFADEKLTPDTRRRDVHQKYLDYFGKLAREQTPRLIQADSATVFAALDREAANIRAAIEWGLQDTSENLQKSLALLGEVRWCWGIRGTYAPYDTWKTQAYLRRDELPPPDRARVILQYAALRPDSDREALLREALDAFERMENHEDRGGRADAHESLAVLYRDQGRSAEMEESFRAAVAVREAAGDQRGAGYAMANFAGSLFTLGRVAEARVLWKQCRVIGEAFNEQGSLAVLDRAEAVALLGEGNPEAAIPLLQSALSAFRHKGEMWQVMDTLGQLARAYREQGEPENAAPFIDEGEEIARSRHDQGRIDYFRALR